MRYSRCLAGILRRALAAGLLSAAICPANAAETAACAARLNSFANPAMLASMRRGVNLPGWDRRNDPPTLAQLQALREAGFTHIRLPLDNAQLSGERRPAYLDAIFEQVGFLLGLDYSVSLDLHPDGVVGRLFTRDPEEAESYLADIWQAVARRVKSLDGDRVAIELLNEPNVEQPVWHAAAERLITEIRKILPDNTIVVGPAGPQRHETLAGMEPFGDPNIIYAVHYYDPFAFTHQGADWMGPDNQLQYFRDLPFPADAADASMQERLSALQASGHAAAAEVLQRSLETPWDERDIASAFDTMQRWSEQYQRPVIVNEFGVLSHVAPPRSRIEWLSIVRRQAESRCIGWAHWDFQDGFGLIDPETSMPDAGIIDALIPG